MASTLSSLTGLRGGNLTVSGYGGVLKLGVKLSRPDRSGSSNALLTEIRHIGTAHLTLGKPIGETFPISPTRYCVVVPSFCVC